MTTTTQTPAGADARRALLAARLRSIVNQERLKPLSFAQQRLWFLDQLEPNSPLYNVPTIARITGSLDTNALERVLNTLVERHEALRVRFVSTDEGPAQVVEPSVLIDLRKIDLSHRLEGERESEARKLARNEIHRAFNLADGGLLRALLIRRGADEHWLVLTIHHIVVDEWSLKVLFRELAALYEGEICGRPASLPELAVLYTDYAVWQRQIATPAGREQQLTYWREQLAGNPPQTQWPADYPRPLTPGFRGRTVCRPLGLSLTRELQELCKQENATLFMVLLTALKALLYRHTQLDDLLVGSPIAGRTRLETEGVIGFFVNTLILRTKASGELSFRALLGRVREATLGALAQQDLPFEELVEALQPERSLSHMPFTKIMFSLQNGVLEELCFAGLRFEFLEPETETAKFETTFVLQETTRGLVARVEYNTDLFAAATIERLLKHYENVLRAAVADPGRSLQDLPLLSGAEERMVVCDWNDTSTNYPRSKRIPELFEAQVERTPNAVAVTLGQQSLTYSELNSRANQLARFLRRFGVKEDVLVGLCMQRSPEMVLAMLAVLKAGGAYVPLDPTYPKQRLAFMLEDVQSPVLLTQQNLLASLPEKRASRKLVCLDGDWELIAREDRHNLSVEGSPDSLAYVMYTSGSTGTPKGVAVPHRGVTRLVLQTDYIQLDSSDAIAQVSKISFDAATFEVWGALLNGGRLVIITRDLALSPREFAAELREQGITAMFLTTALFNQVASEAPGAFHSLRTLIFGGETLDPRWARLVLQSRPPKRLVHAYGPTENTTFTTCQLIQEVPEGAGSLPIGRPIANTRVYILDEQLRPVPIGVTGELYTGGDGLARGYWNRPELTARKFIWHSLGGCSQRLYRTGDLARFRADGAIEFIGRVDGQVKVRGFRVELGEIEASLGQHPSVRECVVAVRGASSLDKRLVAYFVPAHHSAPNASELRDFLQSRLPDFMLPSAFVRLESLPLTPNGKVHRQALPEPDSARPALEKQYVAPRDEVEATLARIWESVLEVHPVGIKDKFFELGGHSLLAVRLVNRIEKAFGRKLRLATVFQAPTVEQLAAILREEINEGSAGAGSSLVEIQSQGNRPPLFLVHGAGGGMFWGYVNLSRHLGAGQPVYGFKAPSLDGDAGPARIEEMAARYVADLRRIQPRGPYYLGGYCFGGNVAYEMARQLHAAGETVAVLALLNCAPPNSSYGKISWSPAWCARFGKNLVYWLKYFLEWTPPQRRGFFQWKWLKLKRRLAALGKGRVIGPGRFEPGDLVDLSSFSADQRQVWEGHICALLQYQPQPYPGRVQLFRSPGHPLWCSFEPDYGWSALAAGGVDIHIVPGAHEKILDEPNVQTLAKEMKAIFALSTPSDLSNPLPPEKDTTRTGPMAHPNLLSAPEPDARNTKQANSEPVNLAGVDRASGQEQTIAIAATFTADPIREALCYWMDRLQIPFSLEFAPYNQVFQQLLTSSSLLNTNRRGVNVILLRFEDWRKHGAEPGSAETQGFADVVERNADEFLQALKAAVVRGGAPWLVCVCPPSPGLAGNPELGPLLNRLEGRLSAQLEPLAGVYLIPSSELAHCYPVADYFDASSDELGHVPYTPVFFTALGTVVARKFHALTRAPYKVIALDCDQTLWCGVCGEDGARGIRLDAPRQALQEFMLNQHAAGMLLCLCSKNNEADVDEVFTQRSDLLLRSEHFAARRLNWKPKSSNLRELAVELNVGLDSFIFVDDNPVECAEVRANCPEVLTILLPPDPAAIPRFLAHCWAFDHLKVTREDRQRGELYRQNKLREELLSQSLSLADFIASLELRVEIGLMTESQTGRVAQLTQRTNQFNFTTRRRTEMEIHQLRPTHEVLAAQVIDRFGDYGLVGVMIYQCHEASLEVDTFLLSCRVLGRGVEHRMLARLGEIALEQQLSWVDVHFTKSPKNKPALDFLDAVGHDFKQSLDGGYLFRFPAGYAAEVAHNAQNCQPPAVEKSDDPSHVLAAPLTSRFDDYASIALEAADVLAIHNLIEAKSAPGAKASGPYAPPRSDMERLLSELWRELLRLECVGIKDNFFELGGHSVMAVRLFAEIERRTGRKLPLITLFHAPTIEGLAQALDQGQSRRSPSLIVPIQPQGSRPPLFLVHGAGGDVLWGYANLAAHLGADQPVYGIKSRGQAGLEEFATLEEMAGCYVTEIRAVQPCGPYFLGGYCFGGNVAYEMARQLQALGEEVALVVLLDSAPANVGYERVLWWRPDFALRFSRNLVYWLADFRSLPLSERRRFALRKGRVLWRKCKNRLRPHQTSATIDLEEVIEIGQFPEQDLPLWRIHLQALGAHIQKNYHGNVALLRTHGQRLLCSLEHDFCWGQIVPGGVAVRLVPGSHEQIFMDPHVKSLALELGQVLSEARRAAPAIPDAHALSKR